MKKYTAATLDAALAAIRAELGPNAVIVHQGEAKRGRLGPLSRAQVEVVAAVDDSPRPAAKPAARTAPAPAARQRPAAAPARPSASAPATRPPRPSGRPHPGPLPTTRSADRCAAREGTLAGRDAPVSPTFNLQPSTYNSPEALREMQSHVQELRGAIARMMQQSQWPGLAKLPAPLADLHRRLLDQEVEPALAQELVTTIDGELSLQAANDPRTVRESLAKHLRQVLPTAGPLAPTPGQPTVVFLIGPTGVGKTTTIAKLAATRKLQRDRVALVTCDTYRVAAIPQLKTYADILRLPLEVAYSPEELTGHVLDHVDADFVFVDTPGRSQRNAGQLADLQRYVLSVPARRTFLTVTAGARYRDMLDVVARFGTIPFDGLLVTKLDETSTFGPILNLVRQTGKPITYVTNGQNGPHDSAVASSSGLTELLLDAIYAPASAAVEGAA
jgi:flagellar biosynthesis protein FlhF